MTIRNTWACLALVAVTLPLAACGHSEQAQLVSETTVAVASTADEPVITVPVGPEVNGPTGSDPSTSDYSGTMRAVYDDATSPAAVDGRAFMMQAHMLEQFAQNINGILKFPYDIPLEGRQCDESNLYWNPADKAIVLCYESATRLGTQFTELGDPDPEKAVYDTELLGFYHESGHMVIDIYDLPAVGREEDAADQVSAYLMLRPNPDGSVDQSQIDAIGNAAHSFAADADQQGLDDNTLADVHSPTKARLYNLACWTYGADPAYGAKIVDSGLLPQGRADVCPDEYAKLRRAWDRLLEPYLR